MRLRPFVRCRSAALASALVSTLLRPASAVEPVDTELPKHDVLWTSPSASIVDSMPIGNGRVAALVWVQSNGELMISVATGDSWDENARSIRLGNVRVALTPSPVGAGRPFAQTLKYKEGEITLALGNSPQIALRVWVDANEPVVHLEASAPNPFSMTVTPELWRTSRMDVSSNTPWKDFIHVAKDVSTNTSMLEVVLTPDVRVTSLPGKVGWYHRNDTSHWAETMANQSIDVNAFGVTDPLTHRTSGAIIQGSGLETTGNALASAQAQTSFRVDVAAHTRITATAEAWISEADALATRVFATNIDDLRAAHRRYWNDLWNRSYVFVTGDADADRVTKGWIAARYLIACQSRAEGPIEFNGGLFTFQNDVKLWHDYTQANQQFAHWGMLPSGDFDLLQSWFDMLVKSLPVGRAKTRANWNHEGAMFAEHMILYGPQSGSHYGWDRTGRAPSYELAAATRLLYGGTMENAVMMLDAYEYTGDAAFAAATLIPFAREVVKWHDQHWQRQSGKIRMSPIYSGERDKNVTNSMVDVAGLTKLVNGLLALPESLTTQADRDVWTRVRGELPAIPISGGRMRPAEDLAVGTDTNNQNLAPIFPYRLYGPTKPDLQIGVDSYNARTGQTPRDGTEAWRHDAAHAAYLGLAGEARTQTIERFTHYKYRYQGFVNGAPDGDHAIEPIAIGKIALQAMTLHPGIGKAINVLNAWPSGWNVQFKLWAPERTWVSGQATGGRVTSLTVSPASRVGDILVAGVAPAGVTITGTDDPGGFITGGGASGSGGAPGSTGGSGGGAMGGSGDTAGSSASGVGGGSSAGGGFAGSGSSAGGGGDAGRALAGGGGEATGGGAGSRAGAGGRVGATGDASGASDAGCGCVVGGDDTGSAFWPWLGAAALALAGVRRQFGARARS